MDWKHLIELASAPLETSLTEDDLASKEPYMACDRLIRDISQHRRELEEIPLDARQTLPQWQLPIEGRWQLALESSVIILSQLSKHLRALNLFAISLYRVHGAIALEAGLRLHVATVEADWTTLQPPLAMARNRSLSLQWFARQLGECVRDIVDNPPAPALCRSLAELIARYHAPLLEERLRSSGIAPDFQRMETDLQAVAGRAESGGQTGAASDPLPPAAATPSATPPVPNAGELDLDGVLRHLKPLAARLYELSALDPLAHTLLLAIAWSFDPSSLELDPAGKSRLPPPPASDTRRAEEYLARGGEPEIILAFARGLLAEHPYWLDIQLLTFRALSALGAADAAQAVRAATARFFQRAPDVFRRGCYHGGSPAFMSGVCAAWLAEPSRSAQEESVHESASTAPRDGLAEIREWIEIGQPARGLAALADRDATTAAVIERVEHRILAARAEHKLGRPDLAAALACAALQLARRSTMLDGHPELALQIHQCLATAQLGDQPVPAQLESPLACLLEVSLGPILP